MTEIDQEDVIQIMKMIEESAFDELHLEMGELKLVVRKGNKRPVLLDRSELAAQEPSHSNVHEKPSVVMTREMMSAPEPLGLEEEGFIAIKAPMLGTFYRAPKPGAPPFVKEGQLISEEETVCIIEVMKLFNTVKAGVRGRIAKICAENGQMVEYQQTLFLVEEIEESERTQEGRTP
ncbi:MAG: acetyl-CoA carboxylase biotin carboxyl carrier protein [Pseudomonadota bacterium]